LKAALRRFDSLMLIIASRQRYPDGVWEVEARYAASAPFHLDTGNAFLMAP